MDYPCSFSCNLSNSPVNLCLSQMLYWSVFSIQLILMYCMITEAYHPEQGDMLLMIIIILLSIVIVNIPHSVV